MRSLDSMSDLVGASHPSPRSGSEARTTAFGCLGGRETDAMAAVPLPLPQVPMDRLDVVLELLRVRLSVPAHFVEHGV
jgi:hypothetical protein